MIETTRGGTYTEVTGLGMHLLKISRREQYYKCVLHPETGYSLRETTEHILASVHEISGKPMIYPVPFGNQTIGMARGYMDGILRRSISEALKLEEWKKIDGYKGMKTGPRRLTREQTGFLFNLIKQRFEKDTPDRERHESAHHLWKSGLSPEVLDDAFSFMFPPEPTTIPEI